MSKTAIEEGFKTLKDNLELIDKIAKQKKHYLDGVKTIKYAFKEGINAGLQQSSSKDARIKELEARLETAERTFNEINTAISSRSMGENSFSWYIEQIRIKIAPFLTNKTE